MSLSDRVPRKLLSDEVYERIKEAIVIGELKPGERVKDSELAARMGLSRTPVREALAKLADTGLVEATPGVSTRITMLNRNAVSATLSVLGALDELAIRTAVPLMTDDDLVTLSRINEEFEAAVAQVDVKAALDADDRFHAVPIAISGNPLLGRLTEQLHPQVHRILYRKFSTLYGGKNTVDHHARLVEIFAEKDVDAAAKSSSEHWVKLRDLIEDLFENDQMEDQ